MKEYAFRFLVALVTFTIGVVPARIWNDLFFSPAPVQIEIIDKVKPPKKLYATSPRGKIEVIFRNFGKIENRPTLVFELVNRNTKPAKYWSEKEKANFSYVKFNGKEREVYLCGTGMREFELSPGDSFTVEVLSDNFLSEYLVKKGSIQIGYGFVFEKNKFEKFWSEPLLLSDAVKNEIIKNSPFK